MFTREGNNLRMRKEISLKEALLGFEFKIKHLDGHEVIIKKKEGQTTQPNEVMKFIGEGMPKYGSPSEFGDLLIEFTVKLPSTLNSEQIQSYKTFFA